MKNQKKLSTKATRSLLTPLFALAAAALLAAVPASAQPVNDDPAAYSFSSYYTHTNSDSIVSYDWNAGNLYYSTATASFNFGGFYEVSGGITSTIDPASSNYSGASVVSIGSYVYYNDTDGNTFASNIYRYGPTNGTPSLTLTSSTTNYALFGNNGQLYLTGSPDFGTNHIYGSSLNPNGTLASDPAVDLGADSGSSGPIAFDAAGNLYYAPGSGDRSIYEWASGTVASVFAADQVTPGSASLSLSNTVNGGKWFDYSSLSPYDSFAGGTSMIIENGNLYLTLTNFDAPSDLVAFGVNTDGSSNGTVTLVANTPDTPGELRTQNGNLFISDGNQIYQVSSVPEPAPAWLLGLGVLLLLTRKYRLLRNGLLSP